MALAANQACAETKVPTAEYLETLIAPYLEVQAALAHDDLPTAQSAAQQILDASEANPQFAVPAQAIVDAGNITSARQGFHSLSKVMIKLVDSTDIPVGRDLYLAHCPMAFGGKGGDWIQGDTTIANPYYGSMMLRCGAIKKQVPRTP